MSLVDYRGADYREVSLYVCVCVCYRVPFVGLR